MNHYKNNKIALFTTARDKNESKAEFIDSKFGKMFKMMNKMQK